MIITAKRPTTSPSNLLRRYLCPGSAQMEARVVSSGGSDDSIDAAKGKLLHRYWTNTKLDRAFLTDDDRDLLDLSDRLLSDVLNRLAFEVIHEPQTRALPNQRLHDDSHLQPMYHVEHFLRSRDDKFCGTPDQVFLWPARKAALVNDLKTGFAVVERAELNLQLRGYSVLVDDNFDVDDIFVSILQPRLWLAGERITLAHYEKKDIAQARGQVEAIIEASERKDAPLKAGEDQCRYCKAKLICPAFRRAVALPVTAFKSDLDLTKAAREAFIEQRVKECNDEQLEQLLEACALADHIAEPARDEARRRIRDGQFTKYFLGKEFDVRSITNVRHAIALLALSGIASREDILDICKLSIDTVEKRYRSKHKGMTWQQARDKINRVLASVIEREARKAKILRKKL